jgi:DNA-binding transcriptional LysR family regulator
VDLHAIRQFLVVARLEHLSRAADELRVAQPSLSRTIARLEADLGAPLFERSGRLRLNRAGRAFQGHAERALGALDAGRRAVAEAGGEAVGSVRLASETFLTLTGPLMAFKRAHPDVEVELHQMSTGLMGRRLRSQAVDLCVASLPIPDEGLDGRDLLDERVLLATPPDHPLAGRSSVGIPELAGLPFITTGKGHWQRRLLDRLFARYDLTPRIVCEGDEPASMTSLISAGLGLGLIPEMALPTAALARMAVVPIEESDCRRHLRLHWGADAQLPAAGRLMRDTITGWNWRSTDPPHRG